MEIDKKSDHQSCMSGCSHVVTGSIGLILALLLLIGGGYLLLRGIGAYLIVADDLEPSHAIVILSGGTESRMAEALALYNDQFGDVIVLTETGENLEDFNYLHSFDMRIQLLSNGVPDGNILITTIEVDDTMDEARAVKELLKNRQLNSAIVVTDPYHTRRVSMIFRDVFSDSNVQIMIRPVRSSWFNSRTWFLDLRGWQFTILEYLKIMDYKLGLE